MTTTELAASAARGKQRVRYAAQQYAAFHAWEMLDITTPAARAHRRVYARLVSIADAPDRDDQSKTVRARDVLLKAGATRDQLLNWLRLDVVESTASKGKR
jgi:hypothetical protein